MPDAHKAFAVSAVATAPSPATSGTSLVVTAGHGTRFPTAPFNATIWPTGSVPDPTNAEIVRVTVVSTDTLTITRAQESTTARTVVVGDLIAATITPKSFTDIETNGLFVGPTITSGGLTVTAGNAAINSAISATRALTVQGTTTDNTANALVLTNSTPTNLLVVQNTGLITVNVGPLVVSAGGLQVTGGITAALGAFVASDRYVVSDASGNFHRSAIGPAS